MSDGAPRTNTRSPRAPRALGDEAKADRRAMILSHATDMLSDRRISHLTMADLAARCNLAKGSLYIYFPSKDHLLSALLTEALDQWKTDIIKQLQPELNAADCGRVLSNSALEHPTLLALCEWAGGRQWQSGDAASDDDMPLHAMANYLGLHMTILLGIGARPARRLGYGVMAAMIGAQCLSGGDKAAFGRVFTPAVAQMIRGLQPG